MADKLKEIPAKLLEWWNKFTSKQKTLLISVTAGVIAAFVILTAVLARPQYSPLANCESTKEASQIIELLEGADIKYETSTDGYQISVLKSQLSDANLLMGANDIPALSYGIDNVTNGGFSLTESDKLKRYKVYLEDKMEEDLSRFSSVKKAYVQLELPEDNGTLISSKEDSHAAITLELEGEFTSDNAAGMAQIVKTALGNTNTEHIVIMDTEANLLYSGDDSYSTTGMVSGQLNTKQLAERNVQNAVKKVLKGTNSFDYIEVSSKLDIDFSETESVSHKYSAPDGRTEGMLSKSDVYSEESSGGTGGVPGTDGNDNDTTYVMPDYANSEATVSQEVNEYLPDEDMTSMTTPPGSIDYSNSSISVAAIKYRVVREEDIRDQGLLDGITWDEYKAANSESSRMEVDEDLIDLVANASGIAVESITLVAYEEPMFLDREGMNVQAADVVQIILIILILGLLAFVILRSMRSEKTEDVEEELSVETLLQSTPASELEDIGLGDKSETRKMIEKFVDDNPEAAAQLLRNWLNEDWG